MKKIMGIAAIALMMAGAMAFAGEEGCCKKKADKAACTASEKKTEACEKKAEACTKKAEACEKKAEACEKKADAA